MDFQREVIDRSQKLPIIVDFWAPWCGPCKFLSPVIEKLAEENKGIWSLVKVNTDEDEELSNQYKIKGIPAVKMFHRGEVVAEFTGALQKNQIEAWLDEHLPNERKDQLADLRKRFESGELVTKELEDFANQNTDLDVAKILLAKAIIFNETSKALTLVDQLLAPHKFLNESEDLKSLADFMNCELGQLGLSEKIEQARKGVKSGDFDNALEELINVVMIDKNFSNEMPRRATIALFHWLGDNHEMTKKYRRRFDMALY